jgi:phosphatidylglycerol---prolipoprotein diacylglyceryl transferase
MNLAYIPSPSQGVWHLGVFPIRGYALCIIAGVIVAVLFGDRRWVQRGGSPGAVGDIAVWAVPFGLVGGRLYHVLTDPELYFGAGRHPVDAFYIWHGGLGIWGAIALGALGAYIGCRRRGLRFAAMADALAPAVALAQAIGRWGNWFNQELYGKPTTLPWGLKIDPAHRTTLPEKYQQYSTFHPTYLYESIWDVGVAVVVLWADRRFKLGHGRAFALYVMAYTAGRGWIEYLRIDTANHIFGVRLNVWTSIILFVAATVFFVVVGRRNPGRELEVEYGPRATDGTSATAADDLSATGDGGEEPAAVSDPVAADERPGEPSGPSRLAPP